MKRYIILLFASIIFFTGCGKSTEDRNVIQYMYSGNIVNIKQNEEMKKLFEKKYPDIKLELIYVENWGLYLRKILTSVSGDVPLDIIGVGSMQAIDYMRRDVCVPLDEYMKNDPEWEKTKKDIYPQYLLENIKYKGKTYALPGWQNVDVLYYSKKIFDEAGIKYPDETWDINKFLEIGKKLTKDINGDGKIDQFGIYVPGMGASVPWWFGADSFDKSGTRCTLNTPEMLEAFQWSMDLRNKHRVVPLSEPGSNIDMSPYHLFMAGKVAMFIGAHYYKAEMMKINNFEWDVAILPKGKYGQRKIFNNLCCFVILKSSKNPDNAWKLLKFLIGKEYQGILAKSNRDMPILKSILGSDAFITPDSPPNNKKVFVDSLEYSSTYPTCMSNEINDTIVREIEPAILPFPTKTVKEALQEAEKQVNILLKKQIELENK